MAKGMDSKKNEKKQFQKIRPLILLQILLPIMMVVLLGQKN